MHSQSPSYLTSPKTDSINFSFFLSSNTHSLPSIRSLDPVGYFATYGSLLNLLASTLYVYFVFVE